jgi:hypothetical protein
VIDPADGDPVQQIQALTPGGLGVDVACECVGHAVTLNVALEAIRKGGTAAIVGVFEEPSSVHFNDLVLSERTLVGVLGYFDDSPCAIALLADGRINADPLITSRVALDDAIEDGFRVLVRNKDEHVKILINPSGVGSKPSTRAAAEPAVKVQRRGARRDFRLAGGLQLAPAALIARDEGTRGVRRRVGHEAGAAGRRLTGRPSSGDADGVPRRARRDHRRYAVALRASSPTTAAHPPSRLSSAGLTVRSDRPGRYLPRGHVSTTDSHSWWTEKRGRVSSGIHANFSDSYYTERQRQQFHGESVRELGDHQRPHRLDPDLAMRHLHSHRNANFVRHQRGWERHRRAPDGYVRTKRHIGRHLHECPCQCGRAVYDHDPVADRAASSLGAAQVCLARIARRAALIEHRKDRRRLTFAQHNGRAIGDRETGDAE